MRFAVHVYTQVRVKVTGVTAENIAEAMHKASTAVDFHKLLDRQGPLQHSVDDGMVVEDIEWAEGDPEYACVDPLLDNGEIDYDNSRYIGADGEPLVDGKTTEERKAAGYDQADTFMRELLDSVETLSQIAQQHGSRTLADLLYLHSAILTGGFIDHYPEEKSSVLEIARSLPSGEMWVKFIQT